MDSMSGAWSSDKKKDFYADRSLFDVKKRKHKKDIRSLSFSQ
jgi:hypothetical protein